MPRIDPHRLLKCLNPLLSPTGAIKSEKEVDKVYGLMSKFSKKLVSKCMYLNILKATPADVLDLFMQRGGWEMLYSWTHEANTTKNYALLTEIGNLLLQTPATTSRLKENELPKIIKTLSRDSEREETKNITRQVFVKWLNIAKAEETSTSRVLKPVENSENSESMLELPTIDLTDNDNVVILEAELPQNEFDVNQYISNADLNELDFNPEIFNNTVEEHLGDVGQLNSTTVIVDQSNSTTIFAADSTSSLDDGVEVQVSEVDGTFEPQTIIQTAEASGTSQKITPYALVMRNGKHYLMKIQQVGATPVKVEGTTEENNQKNVEATPSKKLKKDSSAKNSKTVVSAGKPSMKTYGLKVKSAETVVALEKAESARSEKSGKKISASGTDEKKASSRSSTSKDSKKSSTKSSSKPKQPSSKSLAEAARVEADNEKFKKKMAEQKKLLDLRKKEAEREKQQKEKDEATLKALKLTVPSKTTKIPRKNVASFADMIGIPGVKDDSKVEQRKIKKRNSTEGASTPSTSSDKASKSNSVKTDDNKPEVPVERERRHRPKVYNNTKSRSLSLLEDMELTLKDKGKSTPALEEKTKADEILNEKEQQPSRISSKGSKRPSTETLVNPDTKKSKTSVEKNKENKKDKADKDVKSKERDNSSDKGKKVVGIQESSLFMDAITAVTSSSKSVKRKRRSSSSGDAEVIGKDKSSKGKQPKSPTEEAAPVKPAFNFYRDTLTDGENDVNGSKEEESTEEKNSDDKSSDDDKEKNAFEPEEGEGALKSALILHRSRNRTKKTVRWREEENLKEFHFFDLDETERVNVARQVRNFTEMKQIERSEERKIIRRNLFGVVDIMEEKTVWKTPLPRIVEVDLPKIPVNSNEKVIQGERERGILEVFYFSRTQIPDSPDESLITPIYDLTPPTPMPFEDVPGVTKVVEADKPSDVLKSNSSVPDINTGMGLAGPSSNLNPLHLNGFGFNVPPPGYNPPPQEQTPFGGWNNNPFNMPIPSGTSQDIWNTSQGEIPGFPSFGNPNMGMMGGMPPQGHRFPGNPPFGFRPPFRGPGPMGPMRFDGPPRGRGFQGRDEFNRDADRDFRRDRDRDRDRYDRNRDRDSRDRGIGGRDRGGREYSDVRGRRGGRIPCKFFNIGKCKLGDKCDFLHASGSQTSGRGDSGRGDYSSRSTRPNRSDTSPSRTQDAQDNWDSHKQENRSGPTGENWEESKSSEPVIVNSEVQRPVTGANNGQNEHNSQFSLPPSSPDSVPPGTESAPIIIPVIAQNGEDEVTCLG